MPSHPNALVLPTPEFCGLTDAEVIQAHAEFRVGDRWFNEAAPITLAASAVRSVVVTLTIPPSALGILRGFAIGVENAADWANIRWALEVGGHPVPGFEDLIGPISDFLAPFPFFWPIFRGQSARVVASNLIASAISNVTAMVRGTYFV